MSAIRGYMGEVSCVCVRDGERWISGQECTGGLNGARLIGCLGCFRIYPYIYIYSYIN